MIAFPVRRGIKSMFSGEEMMWSCINLVEALSSAARASAQPFTLFIERRNASVTPPRSVAAASPDLDVLAAASRCTAAESLPVMSFSMPAAEAGSATDRAPNTAAACARPRLYSQLDSIRPGPLRQRGRQHYVPQSMQRHHDLPLEEHIE